MCVNTFDYNTQDTTDPSVPLPSSVNVTVNAPAKLSFPSLGTSGFTSSSNSYGVTTTFPRLPFTVTNPVRMQFQALGTTGWSDGGSSPRKKAANLTGVRVTRSSNSASTVFDTVASAFPDGDLVTKFVDSGFYLRANSPYLFSVYGIFNEENSSSYTYPKLCFVYAPIKLLPQVFSLTALAFYASDSASTLYASQTGNEVLGYGSIVSSVDEKIGRFTCTTSPTLIDTDNIVEEVYSTYNSELSPTPPGLGGRYGVLLGVTSLAFTL